MKTNRNRFIQQKSLKCWTRMCVMLQTYVCKCVEVGCEKRLETNNNGVTERKNRVIILFKTFTSQTSTTTTTTKHMHQPATSCFPFLLCRFSLFLTFSHSFILSAPFFFLALSRFSFIFSFFMVFYFRLVRICGDFTKHWTLGCQAIKYFPYRRGVEESLLRLNTSAFFSVWAKFKTS